MKALKNKTILVLAVGATLGMASCGGQSASASGLSVSQSGSASGLSVSQSVPAIKGEFIKASEREEMKKLWQSAADQGKSEAYDPAAYLTAKGYSIAKSYTTTESAWPQTADVLATYRAADTEELCNSIEGLVQYDNIGKLVGAMAVEQADGLPYKLSEDKKTYTFEIRQGYYWVDNKGHMKAEVTADDFVAGLQHGLDAQGGLEYLVDGVVKNAHEYLTGAITDFAEVGVRAKSKYTLEFELEAPESYFPSRLVYSIFMPMNRKFFQAKGGAFGVDAFAEAAKSDDYKYGIPNDVTSLLYNSAYYCSKWETTASSGEMIFTKNPNFYNAAKVNLETVNFIFDDGSNPDAIYEEAKKGTFAGIGLSASTGLLDRAKKDGLFDTCAYISDTNATTYFGALNLNRGAWGLEGGVAQSNQNDAQKTLNHKAFNNKKFRLGFAKGWDRASWNDVRTGEGVGVYGLRNMYVKPDFVKLSAATSDGTKTFEANTTYGEMVEYYANQLGANIKTADGQDGWYNLAEAKTLLAEAKAEIPEWGANDKISIDKVYYSGSKAQVSQANAFKKYIEQAIGEWVTVNLIEVATVADYYNCGYYCETGHDLPQDFFDGSGWGPDYLDPGTYLDTYSGARDASMIKVSGLDIGKALGTYVAPEGSTYERGDDQLIYNSIFQPYEDLVEEAHAIFDDNARYVKYAQAEAYLLAQGIMVPTYTQGGTYAITRVAPRTISFAQHGLDSDRFQYMVVVE